MDTRQGLRIATIRGIPIRIHFTFLLILPLLAYGFGRSFTEAARLAGVPAERLSGTPWIWGLAVALALFVSVLIHELAHSLYALSRGGKVRSITLTMIGGVSELVEEPRTPGQEAVMALVGPLTSLLLGGACYLLLLASRPLGSFDLSFGLFLLAQLNAILGLFNLLPAFPMDGGRILRGLLARRQGHLQATRIAASVGKVFAILFVVAGFLDSNFLLMIIAFFVYVGAEAEARGAQARAALGGLTVRDLMAPEGGAVSPDEPLDAVAERMVRERHLALPVAEPGAVLGVVTADAMGRVPPAERHRVRARDAMIAGAVVGPDEEAARALAALGEHRSPLLAVVEGGRVVGVLSQRDILRGIRLREIADSLHRPPSARAA
ncbi:MAG TPA: site-2 protease family protein [Anaeromyxobacteraceae bacterium]|nr:site-2 protease family protein [Anaeromyxobacteraceae bacterium]